MSEAVHFDREKEEQARDEGIDRAQYSLPLWDAKLKQEAKDYAVSFARMHGVVTADDVTRHFKDRGIDLTARIGNAMGSLFKGEEWEWTGQVYNSSRERRHAGIQRVWRLR